MPIRGLIRGLTLLPPLLLLIGSTAQAAQGPTGDRRALDRIALVVNSEIITDSEIRQRLHEVSRTLAAQKVTPPPPEQLKRQVIERVILESIQLQLANAMEIRVSDDRLEQALTRIARQNKTDMEGLYRQLRNDGLDAQRFRHQIRNQIIIQSLVEREISSRILVSDSEVDAFLARATTQADVEYRLSHIFVAMPENATPEIARETQARADDLHRQLLAGGDFRQAAIAYSQGQTALEGGDLGWKRPGQLPAPFVTALQKMKPGELSPLLRVSNGFHILRLDDQRGGSAPQPVTQSHVRHILIRTGELVTTDEARRRLTDLRSRLVDGREDFGALARAHSDDAVSAHRGGDLAWVSPGQIDPAFDAAVAAMTTNEISPPVQTPYGLHLLQVLERRTRDIRDEQNAASARQQIYTRKLDERYDQWLRQLRDEAYVEIRPSALPNAIPMQSNGAR